MNIVKSVLDLCIKREGKIITIDGIDYRVLFRMNNDGYAENYITIFTPKFYGIKQGQTFELNGDIYLIIQQLTFENEDYQKYDCVECDETFKVMYGSNDMVNYCCYSKDISSSRGTYKFGITTSSKQEFILPLNADTKRIQINTRFFSGFYEMSWKVVDINYRNGLCYLYAERSVVTSNDDTVNGIADRWMFEARVNTDKYEVELSKHNIRMMMDSFTNIDVSIYKNGELMEHPLFEDLGENDMIQYITIANDNESAVIYSANESTQCIGLESFNIVETANIIVSYKVKEDDVCIGDKCIIEVSDSTTNQIRIEPKLDSNNSYGIKQGQTQLFNLSCDGVDEPTWSMDVDFNGNESNATVMIDEVGGTIEVTNKGYSSEPMILKIVEENSNLQMDFEVYLDRYF